MAITRDQITQLYNQELGRDPNFGVEGGADYWINQSGLTDIEDVRSAVRQSQEAQQFQQQKQQQFNAQNMNQTSGATINVPGGNMGGGSLTLDDSMSGVNVNTGITDGATLNVTGGNQNRGNDVPEDSRRENEIVGIYNRLFGRSPNLENLSYWINSGVPIENLEAAIRAGAQGTDLNTINAGSQGSGNLTLDPNTGGTGGGPITTGQERILPYFPPPAFPPPAVPDREQAIKDAYQKLFGRQPKQEGLDYWMQSGVPIENIEQALIAGSAPEDFGRYQQSTTQVPTGYTPDQLNQLLNASYMEVLGRPVAREGSQYFLGEFNRMVTEEGLTPEQAFTNIRSAIENSDEAKAYQQTGIPSGRAEDIPRELRVPGIDYGDSPTTETEIYERMTAPTLPDAGVVEAEKITREPGQFIGIDSGIGQVPEVRQASVTTQAGTSVVEAPEQVATSTMEATQTSTDIANALRDVNPAAGSVSENAQMQAITQSPTSTDVGTVGPAQLTDATQVQAPQSRTLQSGEMVQSAVDREKAMAFVDQAQAATADPSAKATVQGQLADIMSQFDGGQIPAWAAGAMRTANATLAARGLGASSLAGQAVVQAAMEASLPIAIQDSATQAQFEQQNLSNRQQRAMLSAQQRAAFMQQEFDQDFQARVANAAKISDIANMNFSAEQQIALENARLAQTVELANLSNRQAMVMAETAQIAQLELSNLNNRQQAAVQNANAFLQMDMANLSNEQQITMFDAQSRVNAIFSDAAAENAARQFNAESENQANQFFQSLSAQVQQFNANQLNSMEQFRVEQANMMERFNAQLAMQQEQFNADNQLVVAQSDAQWNRQIATADTAATNMANQLNAQSIMEMSNQAFANAAQILRDQMEFAFEAGQSQADRDAEVVLQLLANEGAAKVAELRNDDDGIFGNLVGRVVGKVIGF